MGEKAVQAGRGLLVVIGLVDGLLSGLLGIGGAVFLVPALTIVGRLSQHQAHGTALAVVPLTAASSLLIYSSGGYVDLSLALSILVTSTIGAVIGARVMHRLPAQTLRRMFALFLFLIGLRMLIG